AELTNDDGPLQETLAQARTLKLSDDAGPADCLALLRLRALDVQTTTDLARLPERVGALKEAADRTLAHPSTATGPGWIVRVSFPLEQIKRTLAQHASRVEPKSRGELTALTEEIDAEAEKILKTYLKSSRQPDLQVFLTYADHL